VARLVAAWPAAAFAVSFELLLQQQLVVVGDDRATAGDPVKGADRVGAEHSVADADRVVVAGRPVDDADDLVARTRALVTEARAARAPGRAAPSGAGVGGQRVPGAPCLTWSAPVDTVWHDRATSWPWSGVT